MKYSALPGSFFALYFSCLAVSSAYAAGQGPEHVVIQSTIDKQKIPRPAYLPHHTHQWLECDGCHHTKGNDSKKIDYVAGQKIERCETCHNSKASNQQHLATLKRAGHKLCFECHLQNDKNLTRCAVCHSKK